MISNQSQFRYLSTKTKAKNQDINKFLIEIEKLVLVKLLAQNFILYNQKFGGLFEKGNKFGGSPNSGTPSAHVKMNDIAFESVSCAAKSLKVQPKTIRNYINKFETVDYLTQEEWLKWQGEKILNGKEEEFYKSYPNFRLKYFRKSK